MALVRLGVVACRLELDGRLYEPRSDVRVERRELLEAGEPEPLEELEVGPVEVRPARRLGPAELDDEPSVEERAERVVGVDPADPLDRRSS